jgi:hypothetical protein
MFLLLKHGQDNNGYGGFDNDKVFQHSRYELMKEQLLNEQKGILKTLEIYHSLITYFFYAIILLSFFFVILSALYGPFKKLTRFLWKILFSDAFLFIVGLFLIMIGFIIMGITVYEIIYETYLWHNNKLKYFENLTEREIRYTHERNYL